MAGVIFYGLGIVMVPGKGKNIRFVNGEYFTSDADEIALLSKRYKHDIIQPEEVEGDEKPKRGRKPKNA